MAGAGAGGSPPSEAQGTAEQQLRLAAEALAHDRPVNADALATTAAELARQASSRLLEARATMLAGRAQAALGAPEVALERFAEAESLARAAHAWQLAWEAAARRVALVAGPPPRFADDDARAGGGERAPGGGGAGSPPPPTERLTARQLQIVRLVASGATDREAGAALGISEHTVNSHLRAAYRRLGVTRRAALAAALEQAVPPSERAAARVPTPRA
ncbi:MAG TPA: helix-turn-helix transcriptional regulator [Conexibacter sp.]|jgi:DNA-binding CsgD family transcriptional regulator